MLPFQSFTLGNSETSTLLPLEKMFGHGNAIIKSLPTGGAFPAEVPIFMVGGPANYGGPQAPNYSPITQPIRNPFTTTARAPPRSGYGQFGPTQQTPIRTPIRNPFTTTTRRPSYQQPAIREASR